MSRLYRGRFAPSPTGALHLGSARTALVAWLRARQRGGEFVLRIEDLDAPRVVRGAEATMLDDLRWLGLDWDEGPDVGGAHGPYRQSQRLARYDAAIDLLTEAGRVYPCTCSRKEIAAIASAPHDGDEALRYPGTCRAGPTHPERAAALRFRASSPSPSFVDELHGVVEGVPAEDFVLRRADGQHAYQLAVVVDDIAMGMTEVVRGDDLLTQTPRQLDLLAALHAAPPAYFHVPLAYAADGTRLAKRHASLSLASLRRDGHSPESVLRVLVESLVGADPGPAPTSRALAETLDLTCISRSRWVVDSGKITPL